MKLKINKKATAQVGIAIIVMAALLLLGSIFVEDTPYKTKSVYNKQKQINNQYTQDLPEDTYIFYLNATDLGKQRKVTQNYPNIVLGSKEESNIIYLGNNFKLNANFINKNQYSFNLNIKDPGELKSLMFYFNSKRKNGEQDLKVYIDGKSIYNGTAKNSEIPLIGYINDLNKNTVTITFELDKPAWYDIFNWNQMEIEGLKVVETRQSTDNTEKKFDFYIGEERHIQRTELNVLVDCDKDTDATKPIDIEVNNYTIASINPDCRSYNNRFLNIIPNTAINYQAKNTINFRTKGYYDLAYSINQIEYNDQYKYKFTINDFNNLIDVVMYGDFDEEIIQVKINTQLINLKRDEIKSIIPYLRFGINEIEFKTKPLEIEEFVIEKNEFIYY